MTRAGLAGPLLLVVCARASAEPARAFEASANLHVGAATAPFFSERFPEATGRGGALVFGGSWHAASGFGVGLSVPAVVVRIREPSGPNTDEPAWGNLMFWGERRIQHGAVDGFLRLAVGAPLADSGSHETLSKNRALAVGDAISGWESRESFAPGVVPFALTAGIARERGTFRGEGRLKLVPMVRIDDAYLPEGSPHGFALSALAAVGGSVWLFPELGFGAFASLIIDAVPQAESARARTLQLVLSPALSYRLGARVKLGTEFVLPVAGALGGNTYALGFHADVEW